MYTERASRVAGAVVWTSTSNDQQRILPDGCMDLLWHDDRLLIAGPDTGAFLSPRREGGCSVGLRLAPGMGPQVDEVSHAFGLSSRQLHRRSLVAFGYGPKLLARILRMQRSIALARTGLTFAETAALAGFADQGHQARDVRDLAGVPLGDLI